MELQFKNVTKEYGNVHAVEHVTHSMGKGVYGLLGVNGAGKTTLMRMICTAITPTSGEILWNGKDIFSLGASYREILGYLPQSYGFILIFRCMTTCCILHLSKESGPSWQRKGH